MTLRPVDTEVCRALAWTGQLWPASGIVRRQCAIRQRRPVAADGGVEGAGARWIDGVVDSVRIIRTKPFDIGPQPDPPCQIERHMDAKAAIDWRRIDESGESRPADARKIVALR